MVPKLRFPTHFTFCSFFAFFILFFSSIDVNAQCAGNDNTVPDVCDISVASSQSINLAAFLGPHTAGGIWNDDDFSGGLDVVNGTLNAQSIKQSGTYRYTYSLDNINGCTDSAVITITIGGYAGVAGANNIVCNDERTYNLFHVFDGSLISPQTNGTWHDDDNKGGVSGYILDASVPRPIPATYSYTYTVPAIGTCSAQSSIIHLSIKRKPISGSPTDLNVCSNNLVGYTNFDLNNLLAGEDVGGKWTELSGTSEIGFPLDYIANIQNIYNTKGAGSYSFMYTVISKEAICFPHATTIVSINIEELLDLTGATLTVDSHPICEDAVPTSTFTAKFMQGVKNIADGSYEVTYSVSGAASPLKAIANCTNGELTFIIPSSNFKNAGNYTISIVNFRIATSLGACSNIMGTTANTVVSILSTPKINSATLNIDPVCPNIDATVVLSGTFSLIDGAYDISYNLTGSNLAIAVPAVMNLIGGVPRFKIPAALIPKTGNTFITITNIENKSTHCASTSNRPGVIVVNPSPDVSNLKADIKQVCQGLPATVKLTGLGALTSIAITYNISIPNTVASQTIPLTVAAGEVSFTIPATAIPNVGLTTLTITNITNLLTGCPLSINKPVNFTVNPIPAIPAANDQFFCTSDNATVANLQPQGSQYQWFDSVSTVPLISTKPLVAGNYSVKEVNASTGCESSLKPIVVQINTTPQINSAIAAIPSICQGSNAVVYFAAGTTNLTDGDYSILYSLNGSNVTTTPVPAILKVTGGMPTFTINSNLIPIAGNTTVRITNITNSLTTCSNTSTFSKVFVVNAAPDLNNMSIIVNNGCLGQNLNVDITGLTNLANITLSYAVTGVNPISSQTIPLVVSGGKTSFLIPGSSLSTLGSSTLIITEIANAGNSCPTVINSNSGSKIFSINAIPNSPTAGNQEFCETDLKTVSDLAPSGNQYKWYDSTTSTTPLASSKLLVTGNYYVKETAANCQSIATPISVLINTVQMPILEPNGQEFCGIDKPTIQNLSNNTTASTNFTWYDVLTNGVMLPITDLLSEGETYYGFDYNTTTQCYSSPLPVTVSLTGCTATSENFMIPDGFSPNGDGVNETFQIIDIEFLFPNYTLEIFNRYGNVLFKGDIHKPAWDGKNSNSSFINGEAPTGVYFYIIHYNKDNLAPKQGQLYLNR